MLRCSFCAAAWELNDVRLHLLRRSRRAVRHRRAGRGAQGSPRRSLRRCQAYLKTIDVAALSPFPLLAIADMETMDLDLAAMEHGYARPPLKEFTTER